MSETEQDRTKVTIDDLYRKHTRFRLVPQSTTLDDLEGLLRTVSIITFKTRASFGAHHGNLYEDRHYQRRRCSPMILDSGTRLMRIFAVVLKIYVNFPVFP